MRRPSTIQMLIRTPTVRLHVLSGCALLTLVLLVPGLGGCASTKTSGGTNSPTAAASQDAASALTGTWLPLKPEGFTRLEFRADGTLIQAMPAAGASLNSGTWSIESPGVLYFTLNTLGFGVPIARYGYALKGTRLTLTWLGRDARTLGGTEHWDPFIGGTNHLQVDLER